jgi:hypothetical protein
MWIWFMAVMLMQAPSPTAGARGGVITGRVVLSNGEAAGGRRVAALTASDNTDAESLVSIAETDANGRYVLDELPAGRYHITAGSIDTPAYLPGVWNPAEATVVTIKDGARTEVTDFRLPATPPELAIVAGTVRPPVAEGQFTDGELARALRRIDVALVRLDEPEGIILRIILPVEPDGSFRFNRVTPGRYQITAGGKDGDHRLIATQQIRISPGEALTLTLDLQRGFDISGHLNLKLPLPDMNLTHTRVTMIVTPIDHLPTGLGEALIGAGSNKADIKANGDFEIRDVLPGVRYKIGGSGFPTCSFISIVRYGGR